MDLEKIVALERQSPLRDGRIKKTKVEKDSATMYREATVFTLPTKMKKKIVIKGFWKS